ncbi:MAG TPA: hypothetical protein VKF81_11850, partial [Blastocatellia bacterium]|nr:hypothetical protein [Blastocatellia bacterium]
AFHLVIFTGAVIFFAIQPTVVDGLFIFSLRTIASALWGRLSNLFPRGAREEVGNRKSRNRAPV